MFSINISLASYIGLSVGFHCPQTECGPLRPPSELAGTVGQQLEYRVIAINKSGEGQASNTVMVVL
jgi:hypothetical protein